MNQPAVLFDLDGTLLDTLDDLAEATNRMLARRGFPTHAREAYKTFIGNGAAVLVERVLPPDRRDQAFLQECLAEWQMDYGQNWNVHTCLYPGIADLLDELTRREIPLAVLSNKPDEFTQLAVKAYLSRWPFQVVLGASSQRPRKPDPAGAFEVAQRLNRDPQDFYYLGDSSVDMQTAVAAGMLPVGVLWGFRSSEELLAHGARFLLAQPLDLLPLIQA